MIEIAILGYGIVGSGVAEVCRLNQAMIEKRAGTAIHVKKILDVRDFSSDPYADRFTRDASEIFSDPTISVVVETIGGAGIAYELTRQALENGKHVVTSNKELVATHGPELMALAQKNGVAYMFEASVGGGIPIIRPLHKCLSANEIQVIAGILNGTTNFILTRMAKDGIDFAAALAEAQALGYAEQNPAADVDGVDACRKIAILASITTSEFIDSREIYTEGITAITTTDMAYAKRLGYKIKMIGSYRRQNDGTAEMIVAPMLIARDHAIAVADDVNNAIMVEGNALGEAMFFGRGAGQLPTASAVVADVIECAMHIGKIPHLVPWVRSERQIVRPHADCSVRALIRLDKAVTASAVEAVFGVADIEWLEPINDSEKVLIAGTSGKLTEYALQTKLANWPGQVLARIRLF